jgi:polyhydroxybutyrate depolymerase
MRAQMGRFLSALVVVGIAGLSGRPASAADSVVTLQFGGVARSFVLHQPAGYNPAVPTPVMLVEAGASGNGKVMAQTTGFDTIADTYGFFVAYPNPNGPVWVLSGPNNDVQFNELVVADLEANYTIDPSRIYIAGYAFGGRLAMTYACSQPVGYAVAGVAVVSNDMNKVDEAVCNAAPPPPTAFMLFHGTADPRSPYYGGFPRRGHAYNLSAPNTALYWAQADGCTDHTYSATTPDLLSNGENTTDDQKVWRACAGGVEVAFYTIVEGGHTWPGSLQNIQPITGMNGPTSLDLHASQLIWSGLSPFAAGANTASSRPKSLRRAR